MPELPTAAPKKPEPVGDTSVYNDIDKLLEAAGVPADAGGEGLDVFGDSNAPKPKKKAKGAPSGELGAPANVPDGEEEGSPVDDEKEQEEEPEAPDEDQDEEEDDTVPGDTEESEDEAGAETELDGAALASALGLGDADPESLEFNDDGELLIPWKVEDEKGTATVRDLVKGYQLNRNLTHKSEELTQARQDVETERTTLHGNLNQAIGNAARLAKALQERVVSKYNNVDWAKLEEQEGAGVVALRRQEMASEYQEFQTELNALNDNAKKAHALQQSKNADARKGYIDREAKALLTEIPDFADEEKAPVLQTRMRKYLSDKGLNNKEIGNIVDHRQLSVIYDALRWRESQKKAATTIKKVVKTPKIRKGGSPRGKSEVTRERKKAAMSRVRKSGSEFDAGRAMLDLGLVDDVS